MSFLSFVWVPFLLRLLQQRRDGTVLRFAPNSPSSFNMVMTTCQIPIQPNPRTYLQIISPSPPLQTPSSIPTFLHHGFSPTLSANISSASPTCLRSLTSRLICPDNFNFIAFMASTLVGCEPYLLLVPCASPREPEPDRMSSLDVHPSLMTGNCYCRGSDDEERRLRCR
jgi:hypothetical protein